jgi:hypothetical protein
VALQSIEEHVEAEKPAVFSSQPDRRWCLTRDSSGDVSDPAQRPTAAWNAAARSAADSATARSSRNSSTGGPVDNVYRRTLSRVADLEVLQRLFEVLTFGLRADPKEQREQGVEVRFELFAGNQLELADELDLLGRMGQRGCSIR